MQVMNLDTHTTRVPIYHGRIFQVFSSDKVSLEEAFLKLWEEAWAMPTSPLSSRQSQPSIRQVVRPVQRQSGFFSFALQDFIHGANSRFR